MSKTAADISEAKKKHEVAASVTGAVINYRLHYLTEMRLRNLAKYYKDNASFENESLARMFKHRDILQTIEDALSRTFFSESFQKLFNERSTSNPDIIAFRGLCYEHGISVEKNDKIAVEYYWRAYYMRSHEQTVSNAIALLFLASCYERGMVVEKDEEEARGFYQQSIDQGCFLAEYYLGCLYAKKEQYEKALPLLEKAARQGVVEAMSWIVDIKETKENLERARVYYQKAAAEGDILAKIRLGSMLVEKRREEARALFVQSATHPYSFFMIAKLNVEACRITASRDNVRAVINCFSYAAGFGYQPAMESLNAFYIEFKKAIEDNVIQKMINSFRDGAAIEEPIACYNLAFCYEQGIGGAVKLNNEVKHLYELSAMGGNPHAQARLAKFYKEGVGELFAKNLLMASFWYQKALSSPLLERNLQKEFQKGYEESFGFIDVCYKNLFHNLKSSLPAYLLGDITRIITEYAFNDEFCSKRVRESGKVISDSGSDPSSSSMTSSSSRAWRIMGNTKKLIQDILKARKVINNLKEQNKRCREKTNDDAIIGVTQKLMIDFGPEVDTTIRHYNPFLGFFNQNFSGYVDCVALNCNISSQFFFCVTLEIHLNIFFKPIRNEIERKQFYERLKAFFEPFHMGKLIVSRTNSYFRLDCHDFRLEQVRDLLNSLESTFNIPRAVMEEIQNPIFFKPLTTPENANKTRADRGLVTTQYQYRSQMQLSSIPIGTVARAAAAFAAKMAPPTHTAAAAAAHRAPSTRSRHFI